MLKSFACVALFAAAFAQSQIQGQGQADKTVTKQNTMTATVTTARATPAATASTWKRSTNMLSRAAPRRILMIGSSNFSRNFFQVGTRSGARPHHDGA